MTLIYGACEVDDPDGIFGPEGGSCSQVYRGEGTDAGVALRVLEALRSANSMPPVVDAGEPIPRAPRGVLARSEPCRG